MWQGWEMPTLTTGFTPSLYKCPEVRSCAKGITAVEAIYVEYCVFGLSAFFELQRPAKKLFWGKSPCGTQT